MFGLLNINKPKGLSSRDAVNRVSRCVKRVKIGHCGTLDPLATGVLVVALGQATRLVSYVQQTEKTYEGSFRLGCHSPTEDIESDVIEIPNAPSVTEEQIRDCLNMFQGEIEQVPPLYSALKVNGKRAYELARKGVDVELPARPVTIYELQLLDFDYPDFRLRICCGAGTYVRSLGRDIGKALGSGAVMTSLIRTAIGGFEVGAGFDPASFTRDNLSERLVDPAVGLPNHPSVELTEDQASQISFGGLLTLSQSEPEMIALDAHKKMLAILKRREDGQYAPAINFIGKN